jgi:hypothetical protein
MGAPHHHHHHLLLLLLLCGKRQYKGYGNVETWEIQEFATIHLEYPVGSKG